MILHLYGPENSKILILCEPPTEQAFKRSLPLDVLHLNWFGRLCNQYGFEKGDVCLVGLCEPLPKQTAKSAAKKWKFVEQYQEQVRQKIDEIDPVCVVTFGELATRVVTGRPTAITKARGIPTQESGRWLFPMLSPSFVRRIPDHLPIFKADLQFLKKFMDSGFKYEKPKVSYKWVDNIGDAGGHHLDIYCGRQYKVISIDTETQGGTRWWDDNVKLLSVQICVGPGDAYVIPVCDDWCGYKHGQWTNMKGKRLDRRGNRLLVKRILEDPNIKKIGHNIKFEIMMLRKIGIEMQGVIHDTQLMLFNTNENLLDKSLETGVSIYVPELAGYESSISGYDKANMAAIPRDDFITYAAGDADATFRLAQRLKPQLEQDPRQRNCYRRIQMPAILEFSNTVEPNGILVNKDKLRSLSTELTEYREDLYKKLIKYTPPQVKKQHLDDGKELKFSRDSFIRDIYFTDKGFNLAPTLFTDSTQDLPDDQKVAATSIKHLMWFTTENEEIEEEYTIGDYTLDLINMQKATKMANTYSGDEKEGTGFWQYLSKDSKIHPSYMLHRANTARTSSADPNGQNIPVRGMWAPKFDDIFECEPGFKRVSCDLSQIELRLAAWMAMEPTMLKIYQEGGDIHCKTASSVLSKPLEEFMAWKTNNRDEFDKHRYNAKATNFGFIYGLGAKGFRVYAKTDYGIDYTEDECWDIRNNYFDTYYGLPVWHKLMKDFAKEHGYVRSLLGRVRHLPGVYSDDEAIVAMSLRQAVNAPIQGMASELGVIALTRFCKNAPKDIIKVNAFIHDDIRADVREDYAEEAASALKWCVENPPWEWFNLNPPLPILGEVKIGKEEIDIEAQKPDWWN